jgi:hypothetical protein
MFAWLKTKTKRVIDERGGRSEEVEETQREDVHIGSQERDYFYWSTLIDYVHVFRGGFCRNQRGSASGSNSRSSSSSSSSSSKSCNPPLKRKEMKWKGG